MITATKNLKLLTKPKFLMNYTNLKQIKIIIYLIFYLQNVEVFIIVNISKTFFISFSVKVRFLIKNR